MLWRKRGYSLKPCMTPPSLKVFVFSASVSSSSSAELSMPPSPNPRLASSSSSAVDTELCLPNICDFGRIFNCGVVFGAIFINAEPFQYCRVLVRRMRSRVCCRIGTRCCRPRCGSSRRCRPRRTCKWCRPRPSRGLLQFCTGKSTSHGKKKPLTTG